MYGRKSEKLSALPEGQELLFEEHEDLVSNDSPEIPVASYSRSKKRKTKPVRELPRERVEYEPEEQECSCCGEELARIGEEITEELEYLPARFLVIEHVRVKRACSKCKSGVVTGKMPEDRQILERCKAGAGLLTHVTISKYCDHIPLHRQEQIFGRHGVELSRSILSEWTGKVAELLSPVAEAIRGEILKSSAIHADETTLKVQEKSRKGLLCGYLWGLRAPPGVYFHYAPSRASEVAKRLLHSFEGFVHTDAYAGYNAVFLPESCKRVGCWAHVRRKFIEVQKVSGRESGAVLKAISQVYAVEKKVRNSSPADRLAVRQSKTVPILQRLKEQIDAFNERTLPRHPLKKALEYTLNQWKELTVFTTDGLLEADNNPIEREIRPIALGRKNYLFAGSHDGARWAAIFYTLIGSAKLHGVNPLEYLQDIMRRVHTHPASRVVELTPERWKEIFS
jgi:transposase